MRRFISLIFIILVGLAILSFLKKGGLNLRPFTLGEVKGSIYSNSYFRMKMKLPDVWYVYPKPEIKEVTRSGTYFPLWDSRRAKIWLQHRHTPPKILLMMSSHKMGTRGLGNAFFYMWVEKQENYPEQFKNGAEFLAYSRIHRESQFPVIKKIIGQKINIGGKQFYYSEEILKSRAKRLSYRKYAHKWGKYFLVFLTPHAQYAEMTTINRSLKSITFEKET